MALFSLLNVVDSDAAETAKNLTFVNITHICRARETFLSREKFIITMLEGREKSDEADGSSTAACAKPRAVPVSSARAIPTTLDHPSDPPPTAPLPSPAAIAEEAAEVDAILDEWTRGPPTPHELRRTIKRARSTSNARDSPTP